MAAVIVKTTQTIAVPGFPDQIVDINMGVGAAYFYTPGNTGTLVDAGAVTLTGEALTKYTGNSYAYTPTGTTAATGIDFDADGVHWTVAGAGDVPAFSHDPNQNFPNIGAITSATTVTKASGYTLEASNVSGADSVIFQVHDVIVTRPNNTSSYTFTAAELANVPVGPSIIQVVSYKIESAIFSGKTYYFVNETSVSKNITVE